MQKNVFFPNYSVVFAINSYFSKTNQFNFFKTLGRKKIGFLKVKSTKYLKTKGGNHLLSCFFLLDCEMRLFDLIPTNLIR